MGQKKSHCDSLRESKLEFKWHKTEEYFKMCQNISPLDYNVKAIALKMAQ